MSIVFAGAMSHAPGATAWPDAASPEQLKVVFGAFNDLKERLHQSKPDTVVLLTSEHWANFFLDHIGAYCVGRADTYEGPIEPWLKIEKRTMRGDPALAADLLKECYDNGFEPSHAHEMKLDHGSMVPISFLALAEQCRLLPIMFNALAAPRIKPRRAMALGQLLGAFLDNRSERIAVIATGGMSHDPGEKGHGIIDTDFDAEFLRRLRSADTNALASYSDGDLAAAGAGTPELIAWICLAGIMGARKPVVVTYEQVPAWSTGIGVVAYA